MRIRISSRYIRLFRKLPKHIQNLECEKRSIFRNNPFDEKLKAHKLHGKFRGYWAFSVNNDYRIIFEFTDKKTVLFHSIGNHNIYE